MRIENEDGRYGFCGGNPEISWWYVTTNDASDLSAVGFVGVMKAPKNDGRWKLVSTVLELKIGLIASMIMRRPIASVSLGY